MHLLQKLGAPGSLQNTTASCPLSPPFSSLCNRRGASSARTANCEPSPPPQQPPALPPPAAPFSPPLLPGTRQEIPLPAYLRGTLLAERLNPSSRGSGTFPEDMQAVMGLSCYRFLAANQINAGLRPGLSLVEVTLSGGTGRGSLPSGEGHGGCPGRFRSAPLRAALRLCAVPSYPVSSSSAPSGTGWGLEAIFERLKTEHIIPSF